MGWNALSVKGNFHIHIIMKDYQWNMTHTTKIPTTEAEVSPRVEPQWMSVQGAQQIEPKG